MSNTRKPYSVHGHSDHGQFAQNFDLVTEAIDYARRFYFQSTTKTIMIVEYQGDDSYGEVGMSLFNARRTNNDMGPNPFVTDGMLKEAVTR